MNKICVLLITIYLIGHQMPMCNAEREVSRHKRSFFLFPRNAALGIIVAIAVPLDLPKRNVFVSYNFEANYNNAQSVTDIIPGIFNRLEITRSFDANGQLIEGDVIGNSSSVQHFSQGERLLSRRKIYKMLENRLTNYGFNGTQCLLRMICEAAETPLGAHNGILGDLFHIVFTPSSSRQENLDPIYYDVEVRGKKEGCAAYKPHCPRNIFDFITKVI